MGKNKEADRSKTRPSSSSFAASLLPTRGSSVRFGGYLGGTWVEPPVSTIKEEVTSLFQVVDPELSQHLKRLGRKDSTTKRCERNSKGVEVFWKRCSPKPDVNVEGFLFFCRCYSDTCNFFFEGLQNGLLMLVIKCMSWITLGLDSLKVCIGIIGFYTKSVKYKGTLSSGVEIAIASVIPNLSKDWTM